MNITEKLLEDFLYYIYKEHSIYDEHENTENGVIIYCKDESSEMRNEIFVSYLNIIAFIYNQIN